MSFKRTLARLLIFGILNIGAVCGLPMTPEHIERIMNVMNRVAPGILDRILARVLVRKS